MLQYRNSNPNRPPDWRWQYGKLLAEQRVDLRIVRADRYVGLAARFATQLLNCQTPEQHSRLFHEFPVLYEAWTVYNDATARCLRSILEARLLAGQTCEEIAALSSSRMTPEVVSLFETLFFNVVAERARPDYIVSVVFTEAAHRRVDAMRQRDLVWKMFAYYGGPQVLNLLIHHFAPTPNKPTSPTSALAWLTDQIHNQQVIKAALAMHTMPITEQMQRGILDLYYRVLKMDQQSEAGSPGGQESFQRAIKSFFQNVPWKSGLTETSANPLIAQADAQPVALRAAELLALATGEMPVGLETLLASARFPEPKQPQLATEPEAVR